MRRTALSSMLIIASTVAACGEETAGFPQPADTVAVNFRVDDTANKVYMQGDLQWKGAMTYDSIAREITADPSWGGPWATLYDDGPWTAGGHESIGSIENDHIWGVTVFATPPPTDTDVYEYGLSDAYYDMMFGNGWVWAGSNGAFFVEAGATSEITAPGQTFPSFGTIDVQLTVDTLALGPGEWDTSVLRVKGSGWGWASQVLSKNANGTATFTLSANVGRWNPFSHSGLLRSGDRLEFIFVFGGGDGKEYRDGEGTAQKLGVTAAYRPSGGPLIETPILLDEANQNTCVDIP